MDRRAKWVAGVPLAVLALTACGPGTTGASHAPGEGDGSPTAPPVGWHRVDDGPELPLPPGRPLSDVTWTADSEWRLVNLWSSTCGPCRREIPVLNELGRASDIQVVGASRDQFAKFARQFEHEVGADFPSWMDPDGEYAERLHAVAPRNFLPVSALVRDEQVVAVHVGPVKDVASVLEVKDAVAR